MGIGKGLRERDAVEGRVYLCSRGAIWERVVIKSIKDGRIDMHYAIVLSLQSLPNQNVSVSSYANRSVALFRI